MTDQQLLTVEQIASEFQLTSQTIRNWIKSGVLSAVKIGHVYRVRREDVDEMMRRHQGETAPLGTHRDRERHARSDDRSARKALVAGAARDSTLAQAAATSRTSRLV